MVKSLLAILRALRAAWLVELVGAALIVAGIFLAWGVAAALAAGGVALLLKAYELDGES